MKWEKYIQGMKTGGIYVEVRSIKFRDDTGSWRRFRVCSTDSQNEKFTRRPARCRLVKSKEGKIGVAVLPKGAGFVKVGRRLSVQPVVFASLGAISKKPARMLLKQMDARVYETDAGLEACEE